jgi:hypothetical protein
MHTDSFIWTRENGGAGLFQSFFLKQSLKHLTWTKREKKKKDGTKKKEETEGDTKKITREKKGICQAFEVAGTFSGSTGGRFPIYIIPKATLTYYFSSRKNIFSVSF